MTARRAVGSLAAVPWRAVTVLTTVGLLFLAAAAIWVTSPVASIAVSLGVAALAASTALLLDEAAAEAVDATPTTLRTRTVTRASAAVVVLAPGVIGLSLVALRSGSSAPLAVAVQLFGCSLVALAAAATLRRRMPEPGEAVGGCVVALVLALAVARPFDRWVDLFPRAEGDRWAGSFAVWAVIGLASLVVLAGATRDPFDRGA